MTELGADAGAAMGGAAHGAVEAGFELLKIVFGWIVPLITLVIGLFVGASVGLSGLLADVLDTVLPAGVAPKTIAMISDLIAIAIWGAIAAVLWHVSSGAKPTTPGAPGRANWTGFVVRPFATLFVGFAGAEAAALFRGNVNVGVISSVATDAAGFAKQGVKA